MLEKGAGGEGCARGSTPKAASQDPALLGKRRSPREREARRAPANGSPTRCRGRMAQSGSAGEFLVRQPLVLGILLSVGWPSWSGRGAAAGAAVPAVPRGLRSGQFLSYRTGPVFGYDIPGHGRNTKLTDMTIPLRDPNRNKRVCRCLSRPPR